MFSFENFDDFHMALELSQSQTDFIIFSPLKTKQLSFETFLKRVVCKQRIYSDLRMNC